MPAVADVDRKLYRRYSQVEMYGTRTCGKTKAEHKRHFVQWLADYEEALGLVACPPSAKCSCSQQKYDVVLKLEDMTLITAYEFVEIVCEVAEHEPKGFRGPWRTGSKESWITPTASWDCVDGVFASSPCPSFVVLIQGGRPAKASTPPLWRLKAGLLPASGSNS